MSAQEITAYTRAFPNIFREGHETGSRYICYPPVMNTDDDSVFLVNSLEEVRNLLIPLGWEQPPRGLGSMDGENFWESYRLPNTPHNFIVTDNPHYYDRFVLATKVAKKLNLRVKEDRITLFSTIMEMPYNGEIREPVPANIPQEDVNIGWANAIRANQWRVVANRGAGVSWVDDIVHDVANAGADNFIVRQV